MPEVKRFRISKDANGKSIEELEKLIAGTKQALGGALPPSVIAKMAAAVMKLELDLAEIRNRQVKTADGISITAGSTVYSFKVPYMSVENGIPVAKAPKYDSHYVVETDNAKTAMVTFVAAEIGKKRSSSVWFLADRFYSSKNAAEVACKEAFVLAKQEALALVASFDQLEATFSEDRPVKVTTPLKKVA